MCGRFSLSVGIEDVLNEFTFDINELVYKPRFNIAPTQKVLVYGATGLNTLESMRWGLIPYWAKQKDKFNLFNARAETVHENGIFRNLLNRRRCLVLADGFYEWKVEGSAKIPMRIGIKSWRPFGFAGLWDEWEGPDGPLRSCTIITTKSNDLIAPIHNRMPVILPKEHHSIWLDHALRSSDDLTSLLKTYPAEGMEAYQVSSVVNSSRNEDSACIIGVTA